MKEQCPEMWSLQGRFQLKPAPSSRAPLGTPANHGSEDYSMNLNTIMCLPPMSKDLRLVWTLIDQASELDNNRQLIESFNKFPYPTITEISLLCVSFGLQVDKVKVWFMAQRVKYGISWSPEEIIEVRKKLCQKQEQCHLQPSISSKKQTPENYEQPSFTYEPTAPTRTSENWRRCGGDSKMSVGCLTPQSKSVNTNLSCLPLGFDPRDCKRPKVSAADLPHSFTLPSGHIDKQFAGAGNKRPYFVHEQFAEPSNHKPLFVDLQFIDPTDERPQFVDPTDRRLIVDLVEKSPVVDPRDKRPPFADVTEKRPQIPGPSEKRPQIPGPSEKRPQIPGPSEKRPQFPGPSEKRPQFPDPSEKRTQVPRPSEKRTQFCGPTEKRTQFIEASWPSLIAGECKKEREDLEFMSSDSEDGQFQEGAGIRWFQGIAGMSASESGNSMHPQLPDLDKEAFFLSAFSLGADLLEGHGKPVVNVNDVAVAQSFSGELHANRLRNVWMSSDTNGESTDGSSSKRRRKTKEQLDILKSFFLKCQWAREDDYKMLEEITGLTRPEITRWFGDSRYALRHGQLRWFYESTMFSPAHHGSGLQQSLPHTQQQLMSPAFSLSRASDVDYEPLERYLSIKGHLEKRDLEALCRESRMNYQQVLDWFFSQSQDASEVVVSLSDEEDIKI